MFEDRRYVIIPADQVDQINFVEVFETNVETLRYSVDSSSTFVKYDGFMPDSIAAIPGHSQEYTHDEFLEILSSSVWTSEDPGV